MYRSLQLYHCAARTMNLVKVICQCLSVVGDNVLGKVMYTMYTSNFYHQLALFAYSFI